MEGNYIPTPQRTENTKDCHGAHYVSDLEVNDIIMLTFHWPVLIHIVPCGCKRNSEIQTSNVLSSKMKCILIKTLPGFLPCEFSDINWRLTSGRRTSHIHYMHRVSSPDIVSVIPKALNCGRSVLYKCLYTVSLLCVFPEVWQEWVCGWRSSHTHYNYRVFPEWILLCLTRDELL